jgi:hypothetical protein
MNKTRLLWMGALALGTASAACEPMPEGADDQAQALGQALTSTAAAPAIDLVAIGTLAAGGPDLSSETAAPLENGLPGNLLGGMGSGLAWAGGNKFFAVPDRGPNATPYNPLVDDTSSYITRFQTVKLKVQKSPKGSALPLTLTPKLNKTTLLSSRTDLVYGDGVAAGLPGGAPVLNTKNLHYLTGRSDNFDPARPSTDGNDGRFDPESIRVSNDGQSVFISDEYGPYVYEFQRHGGRRLRTFALPPEFAITHLSAQGATEISGNTSGRVTNKGMEGLAISPDGRTLFGAMQSPLIQDGGTDGPVTRIISIDIGTGTTTRQIGYPLTNIGTPSKPKYPTVSEIVAINDHEFLVDERDGKGFGDGSPAVFKKVFRIDVTGAADVTGVVGGAALLAKAVAKTEFLDIVTVLGAHGIGPNNIPAKLEGLAFGPDTVIDGVAKHVLYLGNDNDFVTKIGANDNPNLFFVFAIDVAALPTYVPQQIVLDGDDDGE